MSNAEITIKLQNPEHLLLTFLTLLSSDESPSPAPPSNSAAPRGDQRFRCDGGIVTDQKTGLQWSQDDVAEADLNWSDANAACQALRLGGHDDWRLPTRAELINLVDEERHEPAIDIGSFPSCKSRAYWTATPYAASPSACAWAVYFGGGDASYCHRGGDCRVRAVRGSSRQ